MRQVMNAGAQLHRQSLSSVVSSSAAAFTVAGGICALADLATPFGNMSGVMFVVATIVMIGAALLIMLKIVSLERLLPAIVFALATWAISLWFMVAQPPGSENTGFIAARIPQLQTVQDDLSELVGITRGLERHTGRIADSTEAIAADTREIAGNTAGAKREVSDDPQKELSNLGHSYTRASFSSAIDAGNIRVLALFLDAGMSIDNDSLLRAAQAEVEGVRDLLLSRSENLTTNACDMRAIIYGTRSISANSFLKTMCGGEAILSFIDGMVDEAQRKVDAFVKFEGMKEELLTQCIQRTVAEVLDAEKRNEFANPLMKGFSIAGGIMAELEFAEHLKRPMDTGGLQMALGAEAMMSWVEDRDQARQSKIEFGCSTALNTEVERPHLDPSTAYDDLRKKWADA